MGTDNKKTISFEITSHDKETTIKLIDGELPHGLVPSIEHLAIGQYYIMPKYDINLFLPISTEEKLIDILFKFLDFIQKDQWEQITDTAWLNATNNKETTGGLFELFIKSITV